MINVYELLAQCFLPCLCWYLILVAHYFSEINPIEGEEFDLSGDLVGIIANTEDEIHHIYKRHAAYRGFSVKRSTSKRRGDGSLREKYFLCSRSGKSAYKSPSVITPPAPVETSVVINGEEETIKKKKRRVSKVTKDNCPAMIRAVYDRDNQFWKVRHPILT